MKLFNTIALEINARCNRKCDFCPVAYNTRPDEYMEWSLFKKGIDELASLKYRGRIEFYIYNEPCKDWNWLITCLMYARYTTDACLMIATNGDYLKGSDRIIQLFRAGLNQLLINCYSPGLYEKRLPWLEEIPWEINNHKVYAQGSSRTRALQMVDKSNLKEFGTGIFRLVNRAGNIEPFMPALKEPVKRMCTKPFRFLNINWLGDALVCCQDYHGQVSYGSLRTSTLVELWNHPVMNRYRTNLLNKDRSLPLCRSCDCHAGAYPGNVPTPTGPVCTAQKVEELFKAPRTPLAVTTIKNPR